MGTTSTLALLVVLILSLGEAVEYKTPKAAKHHEHVQSLDRQGKKSDDECISVQQCVEEGLSRSKCIDVYKLSGLRGAACIRKDKIEEMKGPMKFEGSKSSGWKSPCNALTSLRGSVVGIVEGFAKFSSHQSLAATNLENIHSTGFWFPAPIYYLIDYFLYVGQWIEMQMYVIRNSPEFIAMEYAVEKLNIFLTTSQYRYKSGNFKGARRSQNDAAAVTRKKHKTLDRLLKAKKLSDSAKEEYNGPDRHVDEDTWEIDRSHEDDVKPHQKITTASDVATADLEVESDQASWLEEKSDSQLPSPHHAVMPARIADVMNYLQTSAAKPHMGFQMFASKADRKNLHDMRAQLTNFRNVLDNGMAGLDFLAKHSVMIGENHRDLIKATMGLMGDTWVEFDDELLEILGNIKGQAMVIKSYMSWMLAKPQSGHSQYWWMAKFLSQYFTAVEYTLMLYQLSVTPFQTVKHIPDAIADTDSTKPAWWRAMELQWAKSVAKNSSDYLNPHLGLIQLSDAAPEAITNLISVDARHETGRIQKMS